MVVRIVVVVVVAVAAVVVGKVRLNSGFGQDWPFILYTQGFGPAGLSLEQPLLTTGRHFSSDSVSLSVKPSSAYRDDDSS
ncbi:hypothetical protein Tco_0519303 [Tanacetum coccineum]